MLTIIDSFTGKYRWLSNFWTSPIKIGRLQFCSVEQGYVYCKTNDSVERKMILATTDPGLVKRIGRSVTLRSDWERIKVSVMRTLVQEKFKQNEELKNKLLDTGSMILVEGNWWGDKFWGVCKDEGLNWLGIILMETRNELRQQILSEQEGLAETLSG